MAATAQDSSAPLRGASEKKEDTYEEDRKPFKSRPLFKPPFSQSNTLLFTELKKD